MSVCPFKKYKNIFGESEKGVHSIRLVGTAMVDYILTILLAIFISWITGFPLVLITIIVFIISIILHMLFGVNTNTVRFLGLNC